MRAIMIALMLLGLAGGPAFARVTDVSDAELASGQQPATGAIPELAVDGMSDGGIANARAADVLRRVNEDLPIATRGAKEVRVFKDMAPVVVLIMTKESLGSGVLIGANQVLTNWHVVKDYDRVAIIFKPMRDGAAPTKADVVSGTVVRFDEVSDLALLEVPSIPPGVKPISLGARDEIAVGMDVHAIGHPTGEAWTYTKGVVSQIRDGYEWSTEAGVKHVADVIQTQTPINPGNSGGPLISDSEHLLGINAFKASGEGLNFAVSVTGIQRFLASTSNRIAQRTSSSDKNSASGCAKAQIVYEGRNKANNGYVRQLSTACDGVVDLAYLVPDDPAKASVLYIDTKKRGKADVVLFSFHRDGKWNVSYRDTHFNGTYDLKCYHVNGSAEPVRCEANRD